MDAANEKNLSYSHATFGSDVSKGKNTKKAKITKEYTFFRYTNMQQQHIKNGKLDHLVFFFSLKGKK